jgi:hypothetical protein
MTPQERQRVEELFDRLEEMEGQPRDREAERAIAEGLARAPHAIYPLVQTVLVQDEALRLAEDRIRQLGGEIEEPQQERGFLDTVRETLLGPDPQRRGSVPHVPAGGSKWTVQGQPMQPTQPMQPAQDYGRPGGSFLGTAAATAAGVIGGSLLINSLGSMMGGGKAHASQSAFDDAGRDSPWGGGARDSELAREAGLNDIGHAREDRQGFFDTAENSQGSDIVDDGGFGLGGDGGGGDGGGGD